MGFNDQQNKRISNFIVDELRLNPISDNIPKTVIPSIQPTFEVNRKFCNIARSLGSSTTGNKTIFTTPSDKDFYLTSAQFAYVKDVTCDVATGAISLSATIEGTAQPVISLVLTTLTAERDNQIISFPVPLKIDRNTTIIYGGSFTAGAMSRIGLITGYTQETGDVTPA